MSGYDFYPLPADFDWSSADAVNEAVVKAMDQLKESPAFADILKRGVEAMAHCHELNSMSGEQQAALLRKLAASGIQWKPPH